MAEASGSNEVLGASRSDHPSYVLAFGFGTTVTMWGIGFLCRLPPVWVPSWLLLVLLLVVQLAGGYFAARSTGRGWKAGFWVGAVSSIVNLLVLGSLVGGDSPDAIAPNAAVWMPSSVVLGMALSAVGALFGGRAFAGTDPRTILAADRSHWLSPFAWVAVVATFLLLSVGGLVTSAEAGLAVVDWPNSFGYNMFLFPLSRMTGGIYFEHAHRLFGALVGLTTVVLAIQIHRLDSRRWLRALGYVAVVMVIVQGILGGLRVTGYFTTSTDPAVTAPNLMLALVHGVFGQLFFATLIAIATFLTPVWRAASDRFRATSVSMDRKLSAIFVVFVITQLVLGAVLRHTAGGLHLHLTMAVLVIGMALVVGMRGKGYYEAVPIYHRLGASLVHLIGLQLLLGIGALVAMVMAGDADPRPAYEIAIATIHQMTGAILLAVAVMLALWSRRLLVPSPEVD